MKPFIDGGPVSPAVVMGVSAVLDSVSITAPNCLGIFIIISLTFVAAHAYCTVWHCTVLHCLCVAVAACLLLHLSVSMTPSKAIDILRELRGSGAIQTVKVNHTSVYSADISHA